MFTTVKLWLRLRAERSTFPSMPRSVLRHFWNDELDSNRNIGINTSHPGLSLSHNIQCSSKLKYKLAIKIAICEYESIRNDE